MIDERKKAVRMLEDIEWSLSGILELLDKQRKSLLCDLSRAIEVRQRLAALDEAPQLSEAMERRAR